MDDRDQGLDLARDLWGIDLRTETEAAERADRQAVEQKAAALMGDPNLDPGVRTMLERYRDDPRMVAMAARHVGSASMDVLAVEGPWLGSTPKFDARYNALVVQTPKVGSRGERNLTVISRNAAGEGPDGAAPHGSQWDSRVDPREFPSTPDSPQEQKEKEQERKEPPDVLKVVLSKDTPGMTDQLLSLLNAGYNAHLIAQMAATNARNGVGAPTAAAVAQQAAQRSQRGLV